MSGDAESHEKWTPPKLVAWIRENMDKRGLPQPHRLEAEHLVSHALNISRLDIYLQFDKPSSEQEQEYLRELVKRRFKREPLAYILRNSKFWTLDLEVGPGVLIPRSDTELVVETAQKIVQSRGDSEPIHILEFGTGSGAIALSLATGCKNLVIVAVDNSSKALEYARINCRRYEDQIRDMNSQLFLLQCNRFDALRKENQFDMIISNPPYIPSNDIAGLQDEVRQWEPVAALDGGQDGFDYFGYLQEAAECLLKENGSLVMEHGFDQKLKIQTMLNSSATLTFRECFKDYSGHDRVLVYQKTLSQ
jgi:release factor glutamine methyltransferase